PQSRDSTSKLRWRRAGARRRRRARSRPAGATACTRARRRAGKLFDSIRCDRNTGRMPDRAPTTSLGVRQIARTSAADGVRDQLLALIQGGGLAVGDKLPSEHELARQFGVSRPIVREGLGALRAAGVLESRSGSGTYVTATQPTRSGLTLLGRYAPEDLHEVRV